MFCKNCGAKLDDNAKFCVSCGKQVEDNNTAFNQQGNFNQQANYNQQGNFNQQANYNQQGNFNQQGNYYQQGTNYQQQWNGAAPTGQGTGMNARTTSIVAYLTWIGLLIAFCAGDRVGAKFHLNQALVLALFSLLTVIPFLGWLWGIFIFICWIIGLVHAVNGEEVELPLIGGIKILN